MREAFQSDGGIVTVDLVRVGAAIGNHAAQTHLIVPRLGVDRRDDAVHGEDGVEIVRGHDQRTFGVLERRSKAPADHVAEHIENDDVGVFEQPVLLEKLDGLADDIAPAARPRRRPTRLHAHDARIAGCDKVLDPQFLAVELHRLSASITVGARRLVSVKVKSCFGSQPICRTRCPSLAKATDRLDEVVLLPIPPLP